MTMIDWALIAVIAISTVFSIWRGAVREVLSLTTWVLAGFLAFRFHAVFAVMLAPYIESPVLSSLLTALLIIVVVVIVGTLLSTAIAKGVSRVGLGPIDKLFGMIFGALRGVIIIVIPVMMLQVTEIPSESWWKNSKLLPFFDDVAAQATDWFSTHGGVDLKAKLKEYVQAAAPEGTSTDSSDTSTNPVTIGNPATSDIDMPNSQVVMPDETPKSPKPATDGAGTSINPEQIIQQLEQQ